MTDRDQTAEIAALKAENVRLQKIIDALMENAERSSGLQHSDFSLFQTAIMLEDQVNLRTAELQAALRDNERMTEALRRPLRIADRLGIPGYR